MLTAFIPKVATSNKLYTQSSSLNIQNNSFSGMGARLWNQIPEHVRNLSKTNFNKEIAKHFYSKLNGDSYNVEICKLFK